MTTEIRFELKDGSFTEWLYLDRIEPIFTPKEMNKVHIRNTENKTNIEGEIIIKQTKT